MWNGQLVKLVAQMLGKINPPLFMQLSAHNITESSNYEGIKASLSLSKVRAWYKLNQHTFLNDEVMTCEHDP